MRSGGLMSRRFVFFNTIFRHPHLIAGKPVNESDHVFLLLVLIVSCQMAASDPRFQINVDSHEGSALAEVIVFAKC